jgi:hypothetical protein
MNRRQFNYLGGAFILGEMFGIPPIALGDDKTTINGDFYLLTPANNKEQKWGLRANDVTIDGLSFPKFTWQWIGINLASGVLMGIGGQLFTAVTNAIFGGTGQSMEPLLKAQLEAFARIVQQAITNAEIQRYASLMESCFDRFEEISRTPDRNRLGRLLDDTSDHLRALGDLDFPAYRTYMSGASLRLAALQEGIKRRLSVVEDFEAQVQKSVAKHREMIAYIDDQTTPPTTLLRTEKRSAGLIRALSGCRGQIAICAPAHVASTSSRFGSRQISWATQLKATFR